MSGSPIKHISDISLGTATGAMAVGFTLGQFNEVLQAFAFIAGIISASAATYYYWKRSRDDKK